MASRRWCLMLVLFRPDLLGMLSVLPIGLFMKHRAAKSHPCHAAVAAQYLALRIGARTTGTDLVQHHICIITVQALQRTAGAVLPLDRVVAAEQPQPPPAVATSQGAQPQVNLVAYRCSKH